MWYIFEKRIVQGYQKWYSHVSNSKIHKYKYTNTQIHKYSIWRSARKTPHIAVICHQRTSTAGVLFSIWRTFFHRERERDHSEHAMPYHAIPINKYAKQKQQVHQSKQQICHLNQKNTPTKTPSTPSQPKEYANQNTKYAISIKRVRQPKHQVRHLNQKNTQPKHQIHNLNQKNTPMWILVPNIDLRCFVVRQLLLRIYALFGVQFEVLKIALAYKKWQITGMHLLRSNQSCNNGWVGGGWSAVMVG